MAEGNNHQQNIELQRIKVSGFKSIKEMDLELRPLNVLIGANGAGKSNFLQVFTFIKKIVTGSLRSYTLQAGGANSLLFDGLKVSQEAHFWMDFGTNFYSVNLKYGEDAAFYIASEKIGYKGSDLKGHNSIDLGNGFETSLKNSSELFARYLAEELSKWQVYHFHDTTSTARIKQFSALHNNAALDPDGGNLAAYLYHLKTSFPYQYYDQIVRVVRLAVPYFDDFYLKPEAENGEHIRLRWKQKEVDEIFGASALSDGSLRFICLTTLLEQPELPKLIIIDEPELGLHPAAITYLAAMVKSAATRRQVILSTQSVDMLNEFEPEDIVVSEQGLEGSAFHRLDTQGLKTWLEEYSLGEIWLKNIIGGKP